MTRWVLSAAGMLVLYALAAGLGSAGPTGAALEPAAIVLLAAAIAMALGHVLGAWRSRDPIAGWALSRNAAVVALVVLSVLALPLGRFAFSLPFPLVAGYLAARRSLHASDAMFLGIVAALALLLPPRAELWESLPEALVPVGLVAAALGLREAWDVGGISAAARARAAPLADGSEGAPLQRRAAARAVALAWSVVLVAAVGALVLALLREGVLAGLRDGPTAELVLLLAASLGAFAWLQRRLP